LSAISDIGGGFIATSSGTPMTTMSEPLSSSAQQPHARWIKRNVLDMYMAHPFPQWSTEERHRRLAYELCRYKFLGLEDALRGARLIEVGCGTGMRTMLAAQHYGVREFVGFDHSRASLDVARRIANEDGFDRFTPVEGDLFSIPYEDNSFDVVVSWGVLHHTHDPWRGFLEMTRICKPGGYVALFLYNKYNHWRHNLQKDKVSRLAGDDFEARFRVAHQLYGVKPIDDMSPEEVAYFYDKYCHPHKSDHTYGETLGWFDKLGVQFQGSFPPLRMRDAVGYIQYRDALQDRFPLRARSNRRIASIFKRLPKAYDHGGPFLRPSVLHNAFWQGVLMWMGRAGEYSDGSAFSGRMPDPKPTR
jgi:ubiquinone/menaquinone biosynthesis C-methylase UbiE